MPPTTETASSNSQNFVTWKNGKKMPALNSRKDAAIKNGTKRWCSGVESGMAYGVGEIADPARKKEKSGIRDSFLQNDIKY